MRTFSLKTKFTMMGVAVLLGVVALAYTGYAAVDRLLRLAELETVTNVIRHHMELDMMHDGIRGDVYISASSFQHRQTNEIEKAKEVLKEHIVIVRENIEAVRKTQTPNDITAAYEVIAPAFDEYGKKAMQVLEVMIADISSGRANHTDAIADFEKQFEFLEGVMADTSDKVQVWSQQIKDDGIKTADEVRQQITLVLIISVLLALLAPIYARVSLFRGIARLEDVADRLANEDYDIDIPSINRQDEIGRLARALNTLRVSAAQAFILKRMVDDMPINILTADVNDDFRIKYANKTTLETLRTVQAHLPISAGDVIGQSIDIFHTDPQMVRGVLSNPQNLPHHARVKLGPESIQQTVSAMFDKKGNYTGVMLAWSIVTEHDQLANTFEQSIGAVSEQISTSAVSLNQGAVMLQSSIEDLFDSASNIKKLVHDAMNIVCEASAKGEEAQGSMLHLSQSASRVAGIVSIIQQIAEKINLLALNATIESARAGEAGKGFAVVANEVKNLATQTANAITEISKQIAEMRDSADQAVSVVKDMSHTIQSVSNFTSDVIIAVEQQQVSTSEIAKNISGADAKNGMCEKTSVLGLSSQLTSVSSELKKECTGFLEKVRKM